MTTLRTPTRQGIQERICTGVIVEQTLSNKTVAQALPILADDPVLGARRTTGIEDKSVTNVSLYQAPEVQMRFEI